MTVNAFPEREGVTTFNGRSGAVVPQKGDYTADMVGAITQTEVVTLIGNRIRAGTADIGVNASLETGVLYLVYQ